MVVATKKPIKNPKKNICSPVLSSLLTYDHRVYEGDLLAGFSSDDQCRPHHGVYQQGLI